MARTTSSIPSSPSSSLASTSTAGTSLTTSSRDFDLCILLFPTSPPAPSLSLSSSSTLPSTCCTCFTSRRVARRVWKGMERRRGSDLSSAGRDPPNRTVRLEAAAL